MTLCRSGSSRWRAACAGTALLWCRARGAERVRGLGSRAVSGRVGPLPTQCPRQSQFRVRVRRPREAVQRVSGKAWPRLHPAEEGCLHPHPAEEGCLRVPTVAAWQLPRPPLPSPAEASVLRQRGAPPSHESALTGCRWRSRTARLCPRRSSGKRLRGRSGIPTRAGTPGRGGTPHPAV